MKTYELMLHFTSDRREPQSLPKELSTVNQIIQKNSGTVMNQEDWGVRRLSYSIAKQSDAHTVVLTVTLPEESVARLTSELRLVPTLLRMRAMNYVMISKPTPIAVPSDRRESKGTDAPVESSPAPLPTPMDEEELDKTIEKILEQKVV